MSKETFKAFGEDFNKMPLYSIVLENGIWPDDKFLLSLHKTGVYWSDSSDLTKMELLAGVMRKLVLGMDESTIQVGKKEKAYRLDCLLDTMKRAVKLIEERLRT